VVPTLWASILTVKPVCFFRRLGWEHRTITPARRYWRGGWTSGHCSSIPQNRTVRKIVVGEAGERSARQSLHCHEGVATKLPRSGSKRISSSKDRGTVAEVTRSTYRRPGGGCANWADPAGPLSMLSGFCTHCRSVSYFLQARLNYLICTVLRQNRQNNNLGGMCSLQNRTTRHQGSYP